MTEVTIVAQHAATQRAVGAGRVTTGDGTNRCRGGTRPVKMRPFDFVITFLAFIYALAKAKRDDSALATRFGYVWRG